MKYKKQQYNIAVIFKVDKEIKEKLDKIVKKEKSTKSILCRSALQSFISTYNKEL